MHGTYTGTVQDNTCSIHLHINIQLSSCSLPSRWALVDSTGKIVGFTPAPGETEKQCRSDDDGVRTQQAHEVVKHREGTAEHDRA